MKLFAFDVDGTLVSNCAKNLDKNIVLKLNKILKEGNAIIIASGRPYTGIIQYLNQLDEGLKFCVCANGTLVTDSLGNELWINPLKLSDYFNFYEKHKEFLNDKTTAIYCYTTHNIGYIKPNLWVKLEKKANAIPKAINIKKANLPLDYPILKFMIASLPEHSKKYESQIDESEYKAYKVMRTDDHFIEFINKTTDKSIGVDFVRQKLNIDKNDVYTFGDSGNDVGMLKMFNGVAMGNATEECKKVAKFVTKDIKEGGLIYALENFCTE